MAGNGGWKVEVTGLRQLLDALTEMDKKAAKVITKGITDAGKDVATAASYESPGTTPLSGWGAWTFSKDGRDLGFNPAAVSGGFKLRRSNFRRRGVSAGIGWDVYQTNAAGAIFEVMGDGSRVTTNAGKHLVDIINSRFPRKQPRSLIPAYYSRMGPDFRDSMRDQILAAAREAGLV
jgi:hypothetical protein